MTHITKTRLLPLLCTTALFALAPLTVTFDTATGAIAVKDTIALAKKGSDDRGGDDRGGDRDDDYDDDRDDDHDDDRDDDNDDDRDDDRDDDSHHRSGGHDDSRHSSDDKSVRGSTGGGNGSPVSVVEVERYANGIEVRYSDGTKESVENGRYERKNSAGRTVEERRATQADANRLMAL